MYYLHTVPFSTKLPPLFCRYHSLLKPQKAFVLSTIHPFRSPRMHSLYPFPTLSVRNPVHVIPESVPFFNISFTGAVPYHYTNFNPRKLEFNPGNSRANTPKVYHCTVSLIVQQNSQTFPKSYHLLNTGNDAIYYTP